jgi:hypothetical protein
MLCVGGERGEEEYPENEKTLSVKKIARENYLTLPPPHPPNPPQV